MARLFADAPQALDNTVEIARRCNLEIVLGKTRLPAFPTPPGVTIDQHLTNEARAGLARRAAQLALDAPAGERYRERLAFEIQTIVQMGFAGYFLIVADFINWARQNGVPVGPGRGSGAGSLVAYSLGITDLDPLRYDLLFERFLNPERVSMPDFDIDFCQDGRDRVIDYVRRKFGAESVSQIATFGTMAARARPGLQLLRSDRQADPGAAGQERDPRRRAQGRAAARRARKERGRGARAARAG